MSLLRDGMAKGRNYILSINLKIAAHVQAPFCLQISRLKRDVVRSFHVHASSLRIDIYCQCNKQN